MNENTFMYINIFFISNNILINYHEKILYIIKYLKIFNNIYCKYIIIYRNKIFKSSIESSYITSYKIFFVILLYLSIYQGITNLLIDVIHFVHLFHLIIKNLFHLIIKNLI